MEPLKEKTKRLLALMETEGFLFRIENGRMMIMDADSSVEGDLQQMIDEMESEMSPPHPPFEIN